MDFSSSRLDNEGEVESLYTCIPNDDVDKKDMLVLCSKEEFDDNEGNVVLSEIINGDEKVEELQNSMTFSSHEEVISYYKKYAKQVGFDTLRRMIKKTPDGHPN